MVQKKNSATTNEDPTKALVLDGPQDQVYELRDILSTWYGSKSKSFPDAVRMRLIPPLEVLTDSNTGLEKIEYWRILLTQFYGHN
jgi:hypothetical protein